MAVKVSTKLYEVSNTYQLIHKWQPVVNNYYYLLSTYHVPDSVVYTSHINSLILTTVL